MIMKQVVDVFNYPSILDTYYDYQDFLQHAHSEEEKIRILKSAYSYTKKIASQFYDGQSMSPLFIECRRKLISLEDELPNQFILNVSPKFESKPMPSSEENMIQNLVFKARKILFQYAKFRGETKPFEQIDFMNYCSYAAHVIHGLCRSFHLPCVEMVIYPAFCKEAFLYGGCGFHYFCFLHGQQNYIVDITYSQFFLLRRSLLERIGIPGFAGCAPGIFMMMDEGRKNLAMKILQDGYFLVQEDTLKQYLDGFAICNRNGIYYEETQDFSFTTDYTFFDYIDFLRGKDHQLAHEPSKHLGLSLRPLQPFDLKIEPRI